MIRLGEPLVLHWDGTAWTQTAAPFFGTASSLDGVSAFSPTGAWAVGGAVQNKNGGNTLILRWNGTAWTRS
jgi:hypothetical protein